MRHDCLLVRVLHKPETIESLKAAEWDSLIRQARRADLLAHLGVLLENRALLEQVPGYAGRHLLAARRVADKHARVVRWEVNRICHALRDCGVPVILLKGAAYVMQDLPPWRGRLFSDVDIMVPKENLPAVERALMIHGWTAIKLDDYDQRYYRQWMQELPPLRHRRRNTVLDVHHRILPETTQAQPDAALMRKASIPVAGDEMLRCLSPADMVIHSAAHLFHEGEFDHGLRDLADLHLLLQHFGKQPDFPDTLVQRAALLQLERPLWYALRYTQALLGTPLPAGLCARLRGGQPNPFLGALMDWLFHRALVPDHPDCDIFLTGLARWLLYVRSHYLRMPLYLLIPHLLRKALKSEDK